MGFLYPLFFISGIPALLYQVVWQRALFTIYGTNTESATAVVAAFLLGLGLGAFAGGWVASRWPTRLLIIYGVIEFVIGLFGLVSLQVFDWVGLRFTAASMAQTGIVAFALVVLPTLLMGATLPILVAFLVARRAHVGAGVGILYFVNTLGSAFACVLAAEFLMEALGQRETVAIAAVLNFVVAGGAIVLGRMLEATEGANEPISPEAGRGPAAFLLSKARACLLAALIGYLSLSFEILWFRAYAFLSGRIGARFRAPPGLLPRWHCLRRPRRTTAIATGRYFAYARSACPDGPAGGCRDDRIVLRARNGTRFQKRSPRGSRCLW